MDPTLKAFLETNTRPADGRVKLADFIGRFRSGLSAREMTLWPRWRIARELAAGGYEVRKNGSRMAFLVGRAFQQPPQRAENAA